MRSIEDTATHHIMSAGLKHQPGPDPVILPQEMLALFTHRIALKDWSSFFYQSYRITTSVCIHTIKNVFSHKYLYMNFLLLLV